MEVSSLSESAKPTAIRYRPNRLGHVNLFVGNYEETCRFLWEICGLEATGLMPDIGSGFYSNGRTHHDIGFIELDGYHRFKAKRTYTIVEPESRGSGPGLNHFGWEMRTERDLVDAYHRALEHGISPRITNNGTSYSNYLFDPGGGQHQLYADNELDWRTAYTGGTVDLHRPANWTPGASSPSEEEMFTLDADIRKHPDKPVSPRGVTHAMILTGKFDDVYGFYNETLGLDGEIYTVEGRRISWLYPLEDRPAVILVEKAGLDADEMHHASFELWDDDDVDTIAERLEAAGAPPVARVKNPYKDSVFIANPDGLLFEFYKPLKPVSGEAIAQYEHDGLMGL
ncbi:MAG: VOC family protein [Novosphingobium sp.]